MKSPLPRRAYGQNAATYRLMAHPVRLEILNLLSQGDLTVQELARIIARRKANISQHLGLLRLAGLVTAQRRNVTGSVAGPRVVYRITDRRIVDTCRILHQLRSRHRLPF
ncbi:MAG: winged helix-turn-helix transcriptional regulator [Candidatus Kerfeldbacteria bacterium]|nr:winged helix-turn-helix transcriptional regulator [Candidatus Kerfeldbacteria bacterium]